jgi:lipopolysaccharide transport system ATP-binding protein
MSSELDQAVRCEGIGKRYAVAAADAAGHTGKEDFWALRDVSFSVGRGEVLGIVGRNGAGKSTLLKILSRIVHPTTGRIVLDGRIAGLLEVGTGFHPELTGRENVFLNGTLLGMSRREVRTKFDQIVDFAGVEYFLETPVKRYSSGMYIRLAFAVAAHLTNEILVLDEVLAVGDAAFQRKCLGKVQELASSEGRTVLLVSHNADVIRRHADRAIRLDRGSLTLDGSVEEVLRKYEELDSIATADLSSAPRADTNWGQVVRLQRIEVLNGGRIEMGADLVYDLDVEVFRALELGVGQAITTSDDRPLAASFSRPEPISTGHHRLRVRVPTERLAPGRYGINVVVGRASYADPDLHYDGVVHAVTFEVTEPSHDDEIIDWHPEWWGAFTMATPDVEVMPA